MKKFYALVFATVFAISFTNAQCTIDQNDTALFNPDPDHVPCAQQNVAYNQTLHFYVPISRDITISGFTVTAYIDSVVLNTITGLPTGLNWIANPAGPLYMPGTHGCGLTSGTTTAAAGNYPISFDGSMYFHATVLGTIYNRSFAIDTVIQQYYGKTYSINVVAQGASCNATGINDFNNDLAAALSVFPNPTNGIFEVKLNAGSRVNGEVNVIDATGRIVYNQKLDVVGLFQTTIDVTRFAKGLYSVQLKTTEGIATKNISVE